MSSKTQAIDLLLREGLITEADHEHIRTSGEFGVWQVLLALEAGADPDAVADTLAKNFDAPRLQVLTAWIGAGELAPEKVVKLRYCVPLRETEDGAIVLAMVDPSDRPSIDDVRIVTQRNVVPMTVTPDELERLWERVYPDDEDFREPIAALYTSLESGEGHDAERLLNLLLLQSGVAGERLDMSRNGREVSISGLCRDSTRELDRELLETFTDRLRTMTRTPRPANLGGLVVYVSSDRAPRHFMVRFMATETSVTPTTEAEYQDVFGR